MEASTAHTPQEDFIFLATTADERSLRSIPHVGDSVWADALLLREGSYTEATFLKRASVKKVIKHSAAAITDLATFLRDEAVSESYCDILLTSEVHADDDNNTNSTCRLTPGNIKITTGPCGCKPIIDNIYLTLTKLTPQELDIVATIVRTLPWKYKV